MKCGVVGAQCTSAGIAARTLANIADMLGAMSRGAGGLRSGPACNKQWKSAFDLLEVRHTPTTSKNIFSTSVVDTCMSTSVCLSGC